MQEAFYPPLQANECRSQICESLMLFDSTPWKRKKATADSKVGTWSFNVDVIDLLGNMFCSSDAADNRVQEQDFQISDVI